MAMYSSPASRAASAMACDVVLAVGFGGVHVQVAAQVGAIDQPGQRSRRGRFDLAARLAQLRRNPVEAERGVDVLLGLRRPRASSSVDA